MRYKDYMRKFSAFESFLLVRMDSENKQTLNKFRVLAHYSAKKVIRGSVAFSLLFSHVIPFEFSEHFLLLIQTFMNMMFIFQLSLSQVSDLLMKIRNVHQH